jgi:hypothetical protein
VNDRLLLNWVYNWLHFLILKNKSLIRLNWPQLILIFGLLRIPRLERVDLYPVVDLEQRGEDQVETPHIY